MTRVLLAALLALPLFLLSGCGELTPCETDLNCVILCECPNGGDGFSSGYRCQQGFCRDGHKDERDCERICQNVVPGLGDDDDVVDDDDDLANDDDSGDDDDSGTLR